MAKLKGILSMERGIFDYCYAPFEQKELKSLVDLIGGCPSKEKYTKKWLLKNIKEAEICITGWGSIPFDEEVLKEAKKLKILFHSAGSVRGLYDKAVRKNIRMVSNTWVNAIPVAEFALGAILSGLKGVHYYQERFHKLGKKAWGRDLSSSKGYYQTTVGIIGLGCVGHKLVDLLKNFDFKVLVYSRPFTLEKANKLNVEKVNLEELMSRSDAVVLAAPNLPQNRHMINANLLSLMKDKAIFINIARGALVNENALIKELKRGRITAFLDVTDPEPPKENSPFYNLKSCILTPHIAGSLGNECYRFGKATVKEIKKYLNGESLKGEISEKNFFYRA